MGNTLKVNNEDVILTSLRAKRKRLAAQLDAVEGVLHGWHTHIMSKDITTLTTIGLLPLGSSQGRPNHDAMERTQLRLMGRITQIDELIGGNHGLTRRQFDQRSQRALQDITIRPIDIAEASLTPNP